MALAVGAYPKIESSDYKIIQEFRAKNDELYYEIAEPHFAFVFPIEEFNQKQFVYEVINKSQGYGSIDFEMNCAIVNKDAFLDYYHLLLSPDKGFSRIIKLHDKLYSEVFFDHLNLDIDFIPHMGIANSKDKFKVKQWVDHWNRMDYCVKGSIDSLTIMDYTNGVLTNLKEVNLL